MSGITLEPIRYNPARSAFEAVVGIHSEGRTFRYPCSVPGGLASEPGSIEGALIAQARRKASGPTALRTVL